MQFDVLTTTMLLLGAVLVAMALVEHPLRRLPLSASLLYLAVGWLAAVAGAPLAQVDAQADAPMLVVLSEWAVLISLFAIGLRIKIPPTLFAWRFAVLLATVGMVATIALAALAAHLLLGLAWPAALLLGAILAPTDPVLASEIRSRSESDRDAVRVSLSTEGALNDGTAFPVVMLALGWLGLHELGEGGRSWLLHDLGWAIGGGVLLGWVIGRTLGWLLQIRPAADKPLGWDELLFIGAIALAYALASAFEVSTFLVTFIAGATMLGGPRRRAVHAGDDGTAKDSDLSRRLVAFGDRCGRLVEVSMVIFTGAALATVSWTWPLACFALAMVFVVRPLAVVAVVHRRALPATQRRLVAWFGIRGIGSIFYLAYALAAGVGGALADMLVAAVLASVAVSIVAHGISATPLMNWYHARRHASAGERKAGGA